MPCFSVLYHAVLYCNPIYAVMFFALLLLCYSVILKMLYHAINPHVN